MLLGTAQTIVMREKIPGEEETSSEFLTWCAVSGGGLTVFCKVALPSWFKFWEKQIS